MLKGKSSAERCNLSRQLGATGNCTWNLPRIENVADVLKEDLVYDLAVCQQEGHFALFYPTHLMKLLQILPEFESAIPARQDACEMTVHWYFLCISYDVLYHMCNFTCLWWLCLQLGLTWWLSNQCKCSELKLHCMAACSHNTLESPHDLNTI